MWIKGKKFTLGSLFKDDELAKDYEDGSVAIFRLAPQDYHRYHAPASCTVETIKEIPGTYYTGISKASILSARNHVSNHFIF